MELDYIFIENGSVQKLNAYLEALVRPTAIGVFGGKFSPSDAPMAKSEYFQGLKLSGVTLESLDCFGVPSFFVLSVNSCRGLSTLRNLRSKHVIIEGNHRLDLDFPMEGLESLKLVSRQIKSLSWISASSLEILQFMGCNFSEEAAREFLNISFPPSLQYLWIPSLRISNEDLAKASFQNPNCIVSNGAMTYQAGECLKESWEDLFMHPVTRFI